MCGQASNLAFSLFQQILKASDICSAIANLLAYGKKTLSGQKVTYLQQNIHAIIRPGEQGGYVAECIEIAVVTQGKTLDEVSGNLSEAVSLHLEDEDSAGFGLVAQPSLAVTFELQPEYV